MEQREPTADELAGMAWWNALTETERADALNRAGDGRHIPSAADAWAFHKRRTRLRVVRPGDET